jgi:preprotein translocase subunit YajC
MPGTSVLLLYVAIIAIMLFITIRPQMKARKEQEEFAKNLQKGDRVITTGGLHGRILKVEEGSSIMLEIDNNVKIRLEKSGISHELTKAVYGAEKAEKKEEAKA